MTGARPAVSGTGAHGRGRPAGYAARRLAVDLVEAVLTDGHDLDWAVARAFTRGEARRLAERDRAFARAIAATVLRRHGQLLAVIEAFLARPLPEDRGGLTPILLAAAAQLLFLSTPPHAAIGIAVEQCRRDRKAHRFAGLANAVLRRAAETGPGLIAAQDPVRLNIPEWLVSRWRAAYGEDLARRIALASLEEAALDITAKADPEEWVLRLGGRLLPTGSIRLQSHGRIESLPGYADGAWWVQDAAAALPVRLIGDLAGRRIADLCAAPGGKTAQLAAGGAEVTAVDRSAERLGRLKENLARLQLTAEVVGADAAAWSPSLPFDAVLLDAPCSATGAIRRHPDILRLERSRRLQPLLELQARLLKNAANFVAPGGALVYCTCSLEAEEGPEQVERFLAQSPEFARAAVMPVEIGGLTECITTLGDLRTLPVHMRLETPALSGLDGFYAARLRRLR